jgi:hypothetical protein
MVYLTALLMKSKEKRPSWDLMILKRLSFRVSRIFGRRLAI